MDRLEKALRTQDKSKQNKKTELAGTMGVNLNGIEVVEVPNRPGFVYVMLNTKEQELIQAFNDKVSEQFGLAVIVVWNVNRYEVIRKDDLRYATWNSSFLPKHGHSHSFDPDNGGGGDVAFIFSKQFVPLSLVPSGTFGAPNAIVASYPQLNSGWHFIPDSPTPNIVNHRPTNHLAKMVLVCMDWDSRTTQLIVGTGMFSANLTGTSDVLPYLPVTTGTNQMPIAGVRLVSGTTAVTWQNIYDVRQFFNSSVGGGGGGGGGTGSAAFAQYYSQVTTIMTGTVVTQNNLDLRAIVIDDSNITTVVTNTRRGVLRYGWYNVSAWVDIISVDSNPFNGYATVTMLGQVVPRGYSTADDISEDTIFVNTMVELFPGDAIQINLENGTGKRITADVIELDLVEVGVGGGGTATVNMNQVFSVGMMGWDEGVPLGTGTVLNFVGAGVTATLSGTVFNIDVSGGGSGGTGFVPYVGANQTVDLGGQALFTSGISRFGTTQIQENYHLHLGANHQLFSFDTDTFPTNSYIGFGDGNGGNLRLLEIYDDSFGITNGQGTGAVFVAGWDANHQHIIGQLGDIEAQDFGNYIEVGRSGTVFKRDGFNPQNFYVNLSGTALSNGVPLVKEAPADGQVYGRQKNGWVVLQTGTVSGGGGGIDTLGFAGMDEGIPLGTGTVLNVRGSRAVLSRSGTVFAFDISPDPIDNIGIFALDDGVVVGTGSTVNFGSNLSVVRTGTTLFVDAVTGASGGGSLLGIMGWDEGTPVGTGTILNATGQRATLSLSGTVLNLNISPDPAELIGVYGLSNGVPLGTGTWIDFGTNLTATISGTVIRLNSTPPTGTFTIQDEGVTQGNVSTINFVGANVQATVSGNTATVNVTGSAGGGSSTLYLEANRTTNQTLTNGTTDIDFNNITTNVGSAWSSGIFTAPSTGIYIFSVGLCSVNTSNVVFALYLNGSAKVDGMFQATSGQRLGSTFIESLTANDTVKFRSLVNCTLDSSSSHLNWIRIVKLA